MLGAARERIRKKNAERCWISLVLLIACNKCASAEPHYHPMEDAIAEKDVHRACRVGGAALLCRLENLKESDLERLDPCLCSHWIHAAVAVPESWLKYSPEVKFLVTTSLVRLMREKEELSRRLSEIREGHFDGVDITIGEEAEKTEARLALQEITELLHDDQKVVSLTFLEGHFSEHLFSEIDQSKFSFVTDFGRTESKKRIPISTKKILYGFSLVDLWNADIDKAEDKNSQKCEEMTSLKSRDDRRSEMKNLLNKMQHAVEDGKLRGIHIRSLSDDDTTGACGTGSFPILHFIRNKLNRDREPFGNFADLDIVLSTGESQEVQFVLDLETPREDLKKLPCERVGFYRHPMDCTKFYHCSEYRAATTRFNQSGPYAGFLYKCPNGLVYDERQGSCIWPSWSDPCRGSGELLPVPAKKFSCVTPGFHVDPENCRYFYYCSDLGDSQLEAFEFLCPSDLLGFDEKKLLCNWKWTVSECSTNGKGSDASNKSISSNKQLKTPYNNRISKALNFQYIPSLPLFNPFPENAHGSIMLKNETLSKPNVSAHVHNQSIRNEASNIALSNNTTLDDLLHFEKQRDRKYGTAIWHRSKSNTTRNNTNNNAYSNPNSLGLNRAYLLENKTEPERPFKGRVVKLDLHGKHYNLRYPDEKKNNGISTERNTRLNHQDFKTTSEHKKDYAIFENAANRVVNDDVEIQSERKSPFMNVKCSKLLSKNREHEDINTLGCTGEVSLTVKLNRGKEPSKYILRNDQITRSYQESQRISDLKTLSGKNKTSEDSVHKSEQKAAFFLSVENNASIKLPEKFHIPTEDYVTTGILRLGRAKHFSQTKPPSNYEISTESFDSDQKITRTNIMELRRNQVTESESMPIHFYPQGVLLNINLAQVNQIPPDVLLEVDYMLRKYMDEGRIDANLLGEKLNASVEKMIPDKNESLETEEITDMIRIIENIISPLDIQEPAVTEIASLQNKETVTVDNITVQTQNGSITTQTSDKITAPAYPRPQEALKKETKNGDIQNISLSSVQNVTKARPFGRGRLFRKFKHPSIREQLDRQIQFQISNPKDNSKVITSNESPTYNLPPYTYPLTTSQHSDKAIRTSFNRLPIHHMSMPTSNDNAIQTSVSPFKDRFKNTVHQENDYGSPLADHDSSFTAQNENDRLDQYLQQKSRNSAINRGLSFTPEIKKQPVRYLEQEGPGLSFDHDSPITVQDKNVQQNPYVYQRDQILLINHDLPIKEEDRNVPRNLYLHQANQSSIVDRGLPNVIQEKNAQQHHYLRQEGQSSSLDQDLPITKENDENAQQDRNGQIFPVDRGLPIAAQNKNNRPFRYFKHEDQDSFINHDLPIVESKNDQQNRQQQHQDQTKVRENRQFQKNRMNINYDIRSASRDTDPSKINASKIQDNISNLNRQRNENFPSISDDILRYKNEPYNTYTQTYPYSATTYGSIARESHASVGNKHDSRQSISSNFENGDNFNNDENAKNHSILKSQNFDRHNRPITSPNFNYDEKIFSYKRVGDSQESEKKEYGDRRSQNNTSNKQTRKRKKLRILVKKLEDEDSPLQTDDDKREIEERVSKSVLKSLKTRLLQKHVESIELQIQYQGHVWNIPFVNNEHDLSPTICTRPGLFQHPRDCNMFYECFWDKWLRRFTLHVFACPVRLVYDHTVRGCSRPSADSPCSNNAS